MPYKYSDAKKAYMKEYYQRVTKNNPEALERNKRNSQRHKEDRKLLRDSLKTPCIVCGEDEKVCIDFHHPNDDKEHTIGVIAQGKLSRLMEEVEKCVCLCSNCHRKVHAGIIHLDEQVQQSHP